MIEKIERLISDLDTSSHGTGKMCMLKESYSTQIDKKFDVRKVNPTY